MGHATGQWSQVHQQIDIWMSEEEKIKVLEFPISLTPLRCWGGICELCINEWPWTLTNWIKEEWAKISPKWWERLVNSYRKCLLQLIVAKDGSTCYWIIGSTYFLHLVSECWFAFWKITAYYILLFIKVEKRSHNCYWGPNK